MCSNIQFVAFRAVGYCLQVVMSNGVTILIGHEVGEFLRFPVEKVQPASFGTDPDIIVFIFQPQQHIEQPMFMPVRGRAVPSSTTLNRF